MLILDLANSVWSVEYTDCISAEGLDSPNQCPGYNTTQSDGEAPVMLELWEMQSIPPLPSQLHSDPSGSDL